jgi:hypothetical protein
MARIRIIYEPSRLLTLKVGVSSKQNKLRDVRFEQPNS